MEEREVKVKINGIETRVVLRSLNVGQRDDCVMRASKFNFNNVSGLPQAELNPVLLNHLLVAKSVLKPRDLMVKGFDDDGREVQAALGTLEGVRLLDVRVFDALLKVVNELTNLSPLGNSAFETASGGGA